MTSLPARDLAPVLQLVPDPTDDQLLVSFELHMRTAKMSPVTIDYRIKVLKRLATFLPAGLLDATSSDLERWQQTFADKAPATVNIYTRHALEFYRWAVRTERLTVDPTKRMVRVRVGPGVPHPIRDADLRTVLACANGGLRLAYVLAAFAGLRAGEITRLRAEDLSLDAAQPVALIHGKGGRERIIPLLPPVVAELRKLNLPRRGVVVRGADSSPYTPNLLTRESMLFMKSLGIESTLHSLRHYFATQVVRLTKDVLLVRDLLGHASVATTQIYMQSSIDGAQDRLSAFSGAAQSLMDNSPSSTP